MPLTCNFVESTPHRKSEEGSIKIALRLWYILQLSLNAILINFFCLCRRLNAAGIKNKHPHKID